MGWKRRALESGVRLCGMAAPRAPERPRDPRSIFVLRNNDIGDLLVVTPLFEALKRTFPRAKIIAGVGSWCADVLRNNPFVDEVLPLNAPWHNGKVAPQGPGAALRYILASNEARELARRRCDIGIDVLGSGYGSLLLMRCGIPYRLGVKGYAGGHSGTQDCIDYDEDEQVGRSALRFAELLGATALPENRPQIYPDSPPVRPVVDGAIVIAPGGGFVEKCWPLENYVQLAGLLAGRKIAVIGGRNDAAAGARLAAVHPGASDLTGRLSLRETFAVVAASKLVICNTSMASHVAAAFRKPTFVLLGERFASARAHAAQWSYPEARNLGREVTREGGRDRIYSPAEVFALMEAL